MKPFVSLILSEIFPPRIGGSGHWLHEIYRRQPPEHTVLLVGEHPNAELFDDASELTIERANLSSEEWTIMTRKGRTYFRRVYALASALTKRYGASEIHCARVMPEGVVGWVASWLLDLKLVCYVHGEDVELARRGRESRWLTTRVLKRSTRLVCNSKNTRSMLTDDWNINPERCVVLHPGIDTTLFKPATDLRAVRVRLGWNERRVILTVSRLEKRKGHDMLIEALPEIVSKCPAVLYSIVGSGVEKARLEAKVSQLGLEDHVYFYGECSLEELINFYQGCDLFILPNRQIGSSIEGFGIVLLEAQACAKVVITGDSGGTVETLEPEKTGLVLDCTHSSHLVDPVARLLNDEVKRGAMGQAARELMLTRFSWEQLSKKSTDVVFVNQN